MLDITGDVPAIAGFSDMMDTIYQEVHVAGDQVTSLLVRVAMLWNDRALLKSDFG